MAPTYKNLKSYQQAVIVCDLTVEFCNLYFRFDKSNRSDRSNKSDKTYQTNKSYRTYDQMVQAARSGKQNIVEGCAASRHNPETEIKLLGVARASFEELLEDYQDFLRQKKLPIWGKDDPRALEMRKLAYGADKTYMTNKTHKSDETYKSDTTYETYKSYLENPEKIANALITLINQTNYLLDQQIKGVKRINESSGVIWEGQNQRASRLQREKFGKERKFDEWIKEELEKLKNKSDKTDRTYKTDKSDMTDKTDETHKTNRAYETYKK